MLTINLTTTPPGLWKWKSPDGTWIPDPKKLGMPGYYAFNDLEDAIRRRYKANHEQPPEDLRQQIIDQTCARMPPGYCRDNTNRWLALGKDLKQAWSQVVQGTGTLLDWWVKDGRATVPDAERIRRSDICATCLFNGPPAGCPTCGGNLGQLSAMVVQVVGPRGETPQDAKLDSCWVCGCQLKAKVRMRKETLLAHISSEQLAAFPKPGQWTGFKGCWLREGLTP